MEGFFFRFPWKTHIPSDMQLVETGSKIFTVVQGRVIFCDSASVVSYMTSAYSVTRQPFTFLHFL